MKRNKLVILVCVAAVMVFVAVKTGNNRIARNASDPGSREAFAELPVNDIARLVITDAYRSIELDRRANGWCAPKVFGHPASFNKIKEALITLSKIKAGEPRKLTTAQRAKARLISPLDSNAEASSKGVLVQAFTESGEACVSLLIGGERQSQGSTSMPAGKFVSLDNGETALITSQITVGLEVTDQANWLDNEMVSVNAFSITNIRISVHGEKDLELFSDAAGGLTMDKLSRKEIVDESKSRAARYVLSYLRFDEVADPALEETVMGFDKPSVFEAVTDKGEVYKLTIGGKAGGSDSRYARINAEFTGTIPPETEPTEENFTASLARKEFQDAKERVDKVKGRNNWTYILAPAKINSAIYTRKDLVTKKKN